MTDQITDIKKQKPGEKPSHKVTVQNRLLLISVVIIILGIVGYFIFRNFWIAYIFAHLGGLGVMVPFGCWAGWVAKKKGYGFWLAYSLGFLLPVILGILTTFWVHLTGGGGCGGIVSIAVALIVVIGYYLVKDKLESVKFSG